MDAIKVKNFIILVLLIVNVVLLSTVISDRMRGSELWNEAVEGAVALLEENGIVVSDEANLSARSLNQRSVARNGQAEAQAVDGFIGLTTTDDRGGGIIYYGGTKGEATFRGTGGFGIQFFASGAPETDDPEKTARSMARDLGIELVDGKDACTIVESDGDNVVLELACASGGARIINCRVEFRFMYGRLYSISGVRPLDLVTAETETSLIDVPTALMRFLGTTNSIEHWNEMYNLAVMRIAAKRGVPMLDVRSAFLEKRDFEGLFSEDGIHPSPEGHRRMFDYVLPQAKGILA